MPNVEGISAVVTGDRNDVYSRLSFGGSYVPFYPWNPRTETEWNAGEKASWFFDNDEAWAVDVSREDLMKEPLKVYLNDDNQTTSSTLIGKAEFTLEKLVEAGIDGEVVTLDGTLTNGANKTAGHVSISMRLSPPKGELH